MSARSMTYELMSRISTRCNVSLSFDDANTLRRAQMTLHTWGEQECGDSNDYRSWAIERDETTGKPFMAIYPHHGESRRYPVADREAGALRRIADVCKRSGLHYFHQTDPRGCALYVSHEPLPHHNYTHGVAC